METIADNIQKLVIETVAAGQVATDIKSKLAGKAPTIEDTVEFATAIGVYHGMTKALGIVCGHALEEANAQP